MRIAFISAPLNNANGLALAGNGNICAPIDTSSFGSLSTSVLKEREKERKKQTNKNTAKQTAKSEFCSFSLLLCV